MGLTTYGVHNTIYSICMYDYVYTVSQIIASLMGNMMKVDGADIPLLVNVPGSKQNTC